jgi:hypothetical protein
MMHINEPQNCIILHLSSGYRRKTGRNVKGKFLDLLLRTDILLRIQNTCLVLCQITYWWKPPHSVQKVKSLSRCHLPSTSYLQIMNGTAVPRIVVFRPIVSIRGPPATPPNRADSGIRLPIHDF